MRISLAECERNEDTRKDTDLLPVEDLMRKRSLEWYGHVSRREEQKLLVGFKKQMLKEECRRGGESNDGVAATTRHPKGQSR